MLSSDVQKLEQDYPEYIGKVKKNYWWNFFVIMLDSSIFTFSVTMLSQDTIIPYYVSQLTDQKFFIGLAPALFFLGYYLPQLIGAYLVTGRPTRKPAIFWIAIFQRITILVIAVLTQMLGALKPTQALILLMVSYALYSTSAGLIGPAYNDFISKSIIRRRGIFFAAMNGLGGIIGFGASLTAAWYLDHYSFPDNLRMLFWIAFFAALISPFLIAAYREVPFPVHTSLEPLDHFLKTIPTHIRATPGFGRFMLVRAVLNLGLMANAFYALYAVQRYGLDEGTLGILTMLILISQSAGGFLWGWLGDRYGFKLVYLIAAVMILLMGALAVIASLAPLPAGEGFNSGPSSGMKTGVWFFYVIAAFIGGNYAVARIADPNMVFELAPPHETSRFIGIANTVVAPVATLGPLLGGLIVEGFSHQALFVTVVLIGVIALVLTALYLPSTRSS
jgi:MFS family permease